MRRNSKNMTTLGQRLPEFLLALGIDTVFGIPGVHTVEMYRGLPGSGIRHITPRHEQGAGFMADGYYRSSGKIAGCFIISGPGMTNIATAMGQAYSDSVPMLVISSVTASNTMGRGEGRLHELKDQQALIDGVCGFSGHVDRVEDLPGLLEQAWVSMTHGRPRPAHIQIPIDLLTIEAAHLARPIPVDAPHTVLTGGAIDLAAVDIAAAESPIIILGSGAIGAEQQIINLLSVFPAPTFLTIGAKGLLKDDNPLCLGSTLPLTPALAAVQSADVVLAIGTELGETETLLFDSQLQMEGRLIRIDIDPSQFARAPKTDVALHGDAAQVLDALIGVLNKSHLELVNRQASIVRTAQLRLEFQDLIAPSYKRHGTLLNALKQRFPDIVIAGDSTQPVYGGNLTFTPDRPRSYFNSSTGYGTLGFGLPAAIGACLACPDRPVICLIGDGGLQFSIAELASATELKLPLAVLVWNNNGYGEIKTYMEDRGITPQAVDIYTPDFQVLAQGFGCRAMKANTIEEVLAAVLVAQNEDRPTVIEIDETYVSNWPM